MAANVVQSKREYKIELCEGQRPCLSCGFTHWRYVGTGRWIALPIPRSTGYCHACQLEADRIAFG